MVVHTLVVDHMQVVDPTVEPDCTVALVAAAAAIDLAAAVVDMDTEMLEKVVGLDKALDRWSMAVLVAG